MSCPIPVPECCSPSAFSPQAASDRGFSKSPCPKLEDSSLARSIHGLLGLGVQSKGSFGNTRATCMVVSITVVRIFQWCFAKAAGGPAVLAQPAPAWAVGPRRVSGRTSGRTGTAPSSCLWDPVLCCRTREDGGGTPPQSLPWALQHLSSPPQPPKCCSMGPSGDPVCESVPVTSSLPWRKYQL